MTGLSTHVLDLERGVPAPGIEVVVELREGDGWRRLGAATTDADGRVGALLGAGRLQAGEYRLRFDTGSYGNPFYPEVAVGFRVSDPERHHHVPLLLSPYGYSTYRGS